MAARIFCRVGPLKGASAEISDEAILGRSRNATLRIQADLVSGEHLRISHQSDEGCYVLEDLGSTNGTALDGTRVRGPERLGHLHVITLAGEYDFIFQDQDRCARRHEELALLAARRFAQDGIPNEHTAIDDKMPVLPAFRDGVTPPKESPKETAPQKKSPQKKSPQKKSSRKKEPPRDQTRIEESQPVLPGAVAGLSPKADGTQIQQVPIALPGFLAKKAEEIVSDKGKPTMRLPVKLEAETVTEESLERLLLEGELETGDLEEAEFGDMKSFAMAVAWPEGNIQYLPLQEGENIVGRGDGAEIRIESPDVSRRHAVIGVAGTEITIRDAGSSNKTFIEGVQLEKDVPASLKHGSRVKFGGVRARVMHWVADRDQGKTS